MIERRTLTSSLVREIQQRIASNEFKPGQKLPPHDEMAAMFGVSRTALREALKQLSLMGFVRLQHGRGTFVSSFNPSFLAESLSSLLLVDNEMAFELLEARQHIESVIAFMAAKNVTPRDIVDMKVLLREMKEELSMGRIDSYAEKNLAFHLLIARASKNRVLTMAIQTIRDLLKQFMAEFMTLVPEMTESAMNYHIKIFKAIERGDALGAQKHMKNHILRVQRALRKYLSDRERENAVREVQRK
ncbi:MAG: FadR family transcriptional regulator [Deltaproteobacteria bacterium]|nr:FadR family transcriptional regulator [Deltaproteobacteria bacterium]MBW2120479.1 FadR family transcriptional regulator [Deltaproteobacteria bacterium]